MALNFNFCGDIDNWTYTSQPILWLSFDKFKHNICREYANAESFRSLHWEEASLIVKHKGKHGTIMFLQRFPVKFRRTYQAFWMTLVEPLL